MNKNEKLFKRHQSLEDTFLLLKDNTVAKSNNKLQAQLLVENGDASYLLSDQRSALGSDKNIAIILDLDVSWDLTQLAVKRLLKRFINTLRQEFNLELNEEMNVFIDDCMPNNFDDFNSDDLLRHLLVTTLYNYSSDIERETKSKLISSSRATKDATLTCFLGKINFKYSLS